MPIVTMKQLDASEINYEPRKKVFKVESHTYQNEYVGNEEDSTMWI